MPLWSGFCRHALLQLRGGSPYHRRCSPKQAEQGSPEGGLVAAEHGKAQAGGGIASRMQRFDIACGDPDYAARRLIQATG